MNNAAKSFDILLQQSAWVFYIIILIVQHLFSDLLPNKQFLNTLAKSVFLCMDSILNCAIYVIIQLFMLFQILYYKAFIYLQVFQKILTLVTSDHKSAAETSSIGHRWWTWQSTCQLLRREL